jgi:glucose/arabinose dehydrogenase
MKKNLSSKLLPLRSSALLFVVLFICAGTIMLVLPSYIFSNKKALIKSDEPSPVTVKALQIADNLEAPTAMAFPGNGTVWITEQTGKIRVIKNGKMSDVPLMDMHGKLSRINTGYDERGLIGITLDPKFSTNKKFYIYYSAPPTGKYDHTGVLAQYKLSENSDQVDPNSGRIILTVEAPQGNHNGGCIQFGPDGYLYLGLGDGGGQGDKHGDFGNGQNLNTWLGKILRIDVNTDSGYIVPKDNPFVGRADVKPEIWAYGFRNPWRFSFDKATKQLFVGDVGQDTWEEVDIVNKGENYGWRIAEGNHCYNPAVNCDIKGITMPIFDYNHREGICIIGGFVYNGKQLPDLKSKYIFADWTGPIFYLQKTGDKWLRGKISVQNYPENLKITSIGEDPSGELYVLTNPDTGPNNSKGAVYKFTKN